MSKPDNSNQFLLYTAPDGAVKVEVFYKDETVWLTQKALAELFGVKVPGINKHLKNIFGSGELVREAAVAKNATTAADGVGIARPISMYARHTQVVAGLSGVAQSRRCLARKVSPAPLARCGQRIPSFLGMNRHRA